MSTQSAQTMQRKQKNAGFTLIELMMVIAIMGILIAIAVPSYRDYLIRSRVQEATSTLSDLRTRMEQYYTDNRNYGTGGLCGNGTPLIRFPTTVAVAPTPRTQYFNFACATTPDANGVAGQNFVIAAAGVGNMLNFNYTINNLNVKTSAVTAGAPTSWIANQPDCWITSSGKC